MFPPINLYNAPRTMMSEELTPCTGGCTFSQELGICTTCGRDRGDLRAWRYMNTRDRKVRMEMAEKRLQQIKENR